MQHIFTENELYQEVAVSLWFFFPRIALAEMHTFCGKKQGMQQMH